MTMRPLAISLVALIALFMLATVFIAVFQGAIGWGWWWAVPVGAGFVLAIIVFRLLIQRADQRAKEIDAELDRLEG